jgi:polysaccharide deacetylase family protein (PEP-CTERM system associated)
MQNAFSVDVEDWYQVSDFEEAVDFNAWDSYESRVVRNTERVLELCDARGVRGRSSCSPGTPSAIGLSAESPMPATNRLPRYVTASSTSSRQAFRDDIMRSKKILEDLTGQPVWGYRAPSFSLTSASLWALDILLECGMRYDSSIFPVSDRLYGIPNARRFPFVIRADGDRELVEFPMSTARALNRNLPLGGGAYLRVFPYAYMRWGIRRVNREGQPALVYMHPWELDPGQPRIKARGKRGISTHYINLNRTESRLNRLLRDFAFAPVRDVLGLSS